MYSRNNDEGRKLSTVGLHWIAKRLVACVVPIPSTSAALWPEEEPLVAGSTLRRRAQFAAGRDAARQAMAALGAQVVSLGQGSAGEPIFPAGLRGSISHSREYAVALVGDASVYQSVGVDIDDPRPIGDSVAADVTWKTEVARIQRVMEVSSRALAQNFAFSAKEAVFKCQYPLTLDVSLRALQARLLGYQSSRGEMLVAGWRVSATAAVVLARIVVRRAALKDATLAIAIMHRA